VEIIGNLYLLARNSSELWIETAIPFLNVSDYFNSW
jgi:hypothetical protein